MTTNRYGLDTRYLCENLACLLRDMENYQPEEMGRALRRLADAVDQRPAVTDEQINRAWSFWTTNSMARLEVRDFIGGMLRAALNTGGEG
jgi:hypothetical protein